MNEFQASIHQHEAALETSLDFINTLEFSRVAPVEHLPTSAEATDWLVARGLIHRDAAAVAFARPDGLDRLRRVRTSLREISEATADHRAPAGPAVAEINLALRSRPALELVPADDGITLAHRHIGDPLDGALATLIEPIVHEVAVGRRDRLRICDNDTCRWVFFDESRTAKRRWCDMATCGNRAKAARHRARIRAGESGSAASGTV